MQHRLRLEHDGQTAVNMAKGSASIWGCLRIGVPQLSAPSHPILSLGHSYFETFPYFGVQVLSKPGRKKLTLPASCPHSMFPIWILPGAPDVSNPCLLPKMRYIIKMAFFSSMMVSQTSMTVNANVSSNRRWATYHHK